MLDAPTAASVIDAGAEFVVAPDTNVEVIRTCNRHGVLSAPGVMTPTEAVTAMEAGADILKMFPAKTVGPAHIGALQGPLGDVDVIPTGGVSPDNVADYFDAGAIAVGAGSAIVDYDAITDGDMDLVRDCRLLRRRRRRRPIGVTSSAPAAIFSYPFSRVAKFSVLEFHGWHTEANRKITVRSAVSL